jgi:hypothetical protein
MQQRSGNSPVRKKKAPRVVLPPVVAPPKDSPFFGISHTNAPARNTKTPNLTEKVTLAKTRKAALTHGGLLTPEQQRAASEAGKALAEHKKAKRTATPEKPPPETVSKPLAKKPPSDSTPSKPLPLPTTAPFRVPLPTAPAPSLASPSPGRRGNPRQQLQQNQPKQSSLGSLLGQAGNAASVGLGTALEGAAAIPSTLTTPIRPGATHTPIEDVKPTHLGKATADIAAQSSGLAAGVQGLGLKLPKTIPSVDVVPTAGAASRTAYTPQELVAAGLTPAQTKKFRTLAEKKGWYKGEIDPLVGLDLIKHAYSSPPPLPLRIAQNFGAGVIRTAAVANLPVAAAQEISSGHGMRFAKDVGNALTQQGTDILTNPGQAFVSDPYGTVPIVGGGLKTLGGIGGKLAEKAGAKAVERSVAHAAVPGATIERGLRSRNLYTASGQMISDFATARSPALSRRADSQSVDKLVADIANGTAPEHHAVQVPYAKTFKKVGAKRAAVLASLNQAGGKPEKILAFYQRTGNKRQIEHWTQVVEASKNLSEKDHAFLAAHKEMGAQTTGANVEAGRFGDTAGVYRAHQPLILADAHAGDPAAQRVQALHEEWVKALRTTDNPAVLNPLHGAYDHAVQEYAQTHLSTGGSEPTRVARTKPSSTGVMQPTYRKGTGGRARFNPNYPKQKASTGSSFETGDYLVDPKVALQENLQAQRIRTSIGLSSDESYAKIGATPAEKGDPRPPGMVFTPRRNAATVGKVITDLTDKPVGAHDYYHEESTIRDRLAKHLEATADRTGEYAAEKGWFVPEGSFNRILDYTRPESRSSYDKFMRQYQRTMISLFPSTVLGNTAGSIPLALAAGAGPKSFLEAKRASSLGGDISRVPHSMHGRGVAGNLAADVRNPASGYMNAMRRANVIGEDFSRDAVYFRKVLPGAGRRAKELGMTKPEYLRAMASGEVDSHIRDAGTAYAIKFAGDAAKPATKTTQRLGRIILFPAWLQHMTKLMLVTLPLHHPRRMALINALAIYGDQYRREHGVLPAWMNDFAPLFQHTVAGNVFTRTVGLAQTAPQGTAGGVFDTLSQNIPVTERVAGLLNPPVAGLVNTAIQEIKNQDTYYPVDLGRFAANQALYAVPGMSKFFPRTGMAPDSLPWSPRQRTYTTGAKKNKWNPDANILPWDQRPGARPLGGWEGIVSRVMGLPLYDVPTSGPINDRSVEKQIKKSKPKSKGWSG